MQIYLVGGAVRDSLLNLPVIERDWVVVGAEPQQLLERGFQQVGKDFPVFLHPETKEEYALARTERKNGHGYTGFDCYSAPDVTLEDDLLRRDLTINAIAQDKQGNLIDPYKGQSDLKHKILRHVSHAFIEDPLRVLRVARFIAKLHHLGFAIADETQQLMQEITNSGELNQLSQERIWKETERALNEPSPQQYFVTLIQCGALKILFPALELLEQKQLLLLQKNAQQLTAPQLFALLFSQHPNKDLAKQLKRLKVPNEFSELAQLLNQYGDTATYDKLSPQQISLLLQQCDAYRRPERFHLFTQCCQAIQKNNNATLLNHALQKCQQVDAKAIAATGITGKAIAEELNKQRLEVINALFEAEHPHHEQ